MILIQNLKFRYNASSPLIINIPELRLNSGDRAFVFGPSGCGKTTLLGLLAGTLTPTAGTVRILGQNLGTFSASARDRFRADHIGYIFQMFNLINYLSVFENIALPYYMGNRPKKRNTPEWKWDEDVITLSQHLGIAYLLNQKASALSEGQKQRVAAARAMLGEPELIIADEPTSALDYDHREKFIELLMGETEKSKATLLFVSHDHSLKKLFPISISLPDLNQAGGQ